MARWLVDWKNGTMVNSAPPAPPSRQKVDAAAASSRRASPTSSDSVALGTQSAPGTTTVMVAVSARPEADATMRAVPPPAPVTRPVSDTVATAGSSVFQAMVAPCTGWPSELRACALSCTVVPTFSVC